MNHRQLYATVILFLALVVFSNVANAQSKDAGNPTQLTSNEISGLVNSDSKGNSYFYSFTVNPGEVSITSSLEADRGSGVQQVVFTIYDRNAEAILSKSVTTSGSIGTDLAIGRINITRRQTVILGINIKNVEPGTGKYRLKVSGAVEFGQSKPKTEKLDGDPFAENRKARNLSNENDNLKNCLPKQGTLIIKMKDGSKKIIDLSEAETVTVVP